MREKRETKEIVEGERRGTGVEREMIGEGFEREKRK